MATLRQLTVSVGVTRSKDYNSKRFEFSATLDVEEKETLEEVSAEWTAKLKEEVKKALAPSPQQNSAAA